MQAEQDVYLDQLNKSTASPRKSFSNNSQQVYPRRLSTTTKTTNLSGVMFEEEELVQIGDDDGAQGGGGRGGGRGKGEQQLTVQEERTLRFMARAEAEAAEAAAMAAAAAAAASSSTGSASFTSARLGKTISTSLEDRKAKIAASGNALRDMLVGNRGKTGGASSTASPRNAKASMSHGKGIPPLNQVPRVLNSPNRAKSPRKAANATKVKSTASHKVAKAMPAWLASSAKGSAPKAAAATTQATQPSTGGSSNISGNYGGGRGGDGNVQSGNDALNQSIVLMSEMEGVIVDMKGTIDDKAGELNEMQEELELTQKQLMEEAAKHQEELAQLQAMLDSETLRSHSMKVAHTTIADEAQAHIAEVAQNHGAEVAELDRQIAELQADLDAANGSLAESEAQNDEVAAAGHAKDNSIAELTLALAARDARIETLEGTVDEQDDEIRRLKEAESSLYETEIELTLQRSIAEQLKDDLLVRKTWKQQKADEKARDRSKKPVWKGGSRHTHAPAKQFPTPSKVSRSPVAKAMYHVSRPQLTFSKPPQSHDEMRTAALRTMLATARLEEEEDEAEAEAEARFTATDNIDGNMHN